MSKLNNSLSEFLEAQQELKEFLSDNSDFAEVFFALVSRYNTNRDNLVSSMRAEETEASIQMGPFNRTKRSTVVQYDPTKLSAKILAIPGVVKRTGVDAKVVATLLDSGSLSEKDVKKAVKTVNITPKIFGPKEIQILL